MRVHLPLGTFSVGSQLLIGRGHEGLPDDILLSRQHALFAYDTKTSAATVTWMGRRAGRLSTQSGHTEELSLGAQRALRHGDRLALIADTGRFLVLVHTNGGCDGRAAASRPNQSEWLRLEALSRSEASAAAREEARAQKLVAQVLVDARAPPSAMASAAALSPKALDASQPAELQAQREQQGAQARANARHAGVARPQRTRERQTDQSAGSAHHPARLLVLAPPPPGPSQLSERLADDPAVFVAACGGAAKATRDGGGDGQRAAPGEIEGGRRGSARTNGLSVPANGGHAGWRREGAAGARPVPLSDASIASPACGASGSTNPAAALVSRLEAGVLAVSKAADGIVDGIADAVRGVGQHVGQHVGRHVGQLPWRAPAPARLEEEEMLLALDVPCADVPPHVDGLGFDVDAAGQVIAVAAGSAAERNGLVCGDRVLAIHGEAPRDRSVAAVLTAHSIEPLERVRVDVRRTMAQHVAALHRPDKGDEDEHVDEHQRVLDRAPDRVGTHNRSAYHARTKEPSPMWHNLADHGLA